MNWSRLFNADGSKKTKLVNRCRCAVYSDIARICISIAKPERATYAASISSDLDTFARQDWWVHWEFGKRQFSIGFVTVTIRFLSRVFLDFNSGILTTMRPRDS
jgi:hypothetical protein